MLVKNQQTTASEASVTHYSKRTLTLYIEASHSLCLHFVCPCGHKSEQCLSNPQANPFLPTINKKKKMWWDVLLSISNVALSNNLHRLTYLKTFQEVGQHARVKPILLSNLVIISGTQHCFHWQKFIYYGNFKKKYSGGFLQYGLIANFCNIHSHRL